MSTERLTYVQKDHQTWKENCLHKFKAKPYLFQSESQNLETVIHEEKSSSLRRKGLGFLVAFHKKPYETTFQTKNTFALRKKMTKEKDRDRLFISTALSPDVI